MSNPLNQTKYILSETDVLRLKPAVAEVAFIGRSNVGKSSCLNALCERRDLAKVSQTPGRTRAINVYQVGHFRWLIDLPGYGFATGPEHSRAGWADMMEGYLNGRDSLKCIFMLIDGYVGPTKLDHQTREWLHTHNLPYRIVANKMDQVKPSKRIAQQRQIAQALGTTVEAVHWISTTKGMGMDTLRHAVLEFLG